MDTDSRRLLHELQVTASHLDARAWEALCNLTALRQLALRNSSASTQADTGWASLATSLQQLHSLDVSGSTMHRSQLAAIGRLPRLRTLVLMSCTVPAGSDELLQLRVPALRRLDMRKVSIYDTVPLMAAVLGAHPMLQEAWVDVPPQHVACRGSYCRVLAGIGEQQSMINWGGALAPDCCWCVWQ